MRRIVDPVQHRLIPAHVTLCREDELEAYPGWADRLASSETRLLLPLTLRFGPAEPFDGHGIMLPSLEGIERFRNLRLSILGSDAIRASKPHLTLAHPRNPKAKGNEIEATFGLPSSFEIAFPEIRLIEQIDGGPWRTIAVWPFESVQDRRETDSA